MTSRVVAVALLGLGAASAHAAQGGVPEALGGVQSAITSLQQSVANLTASNATLVTGVRQASGGISCVLVNGGSSAVNVNVELRSAFGDVFQSKTQTVPPGEIVGVGHVIAGVTFGFCKAVVTSGDPKPVRLSYCGDSACALSSDAP
jgi:hypothetical protein